MKSQFPILPKNSSVNERVNPTLSLIFESRQKPVLQPGLKVRKNLREYLQVVRNLRSSLEAIGKSSVIIGRYRKISRIGLKKSWQV